jgi:hypothetical protein
VSTICFSNSFPSGKWKTAVDQVPRSDGSWCTTPDGLEGQCVALRGCSPLLQVVKLAYRVKLAIRG